MASKAVRVRRVYLKKAKHSRKKFTIPLAIVAGFVPVVAGVWDRRAQPMSEIANYLSAGFTGWSPTQHRWDYRYLKDGALPVIAGFTAHWVANKIGLNKMLGRAGIPFIRI